MSDHWIEHVILGEDKSPVSWLVRVFLWPLSIIYRTGLWIYLAIYSMGIRKRYRLPVPVISVGNLTFGGTGKTPAVQMLCRELCESGKRVVVLSRGHGGSAQEAEVVSDGEKVLLDSFVAGDEPVLLAKTLPGIPVVVGKDRRESGELACRNFKPDVIVLDDGLQYWQLHRDIDIIVLDARRPFGSGFVMPMGDLREPVSGLRRAKVLLLNHIHNLNEEEKKLLENRVSRYAAGARIFRCSPEPACFVEAETNQRKTLDNVKNKRILAFCGIGQPSGFFDMLRELGADVVKSIVFSDHYRLTADDIKRLEEERDACSADALITTEKDLARFGSGIHIPKLYALSIRLAIEGNRKLAEYCIDNIYGENKTASA